MGLLLEFFIAFFGIPLFIGKLISKKYLVSDKDFNASQYRDEFNSFVNRYEATREEYDKASSVIKAGFTGDRTLQNIVQDDMYYVFGHDTRIFEDGKFTPKNERAFGKYDSGFSAHGYDLMQMLLLAKSGKIPPYARAGSLNHSFQLGYPEEIRFLQRIEQTLHQHGVPAQYVLKNAYQYFELQRGFDPSAKKAW